MKYPYSAQLKNITTSKLIKKPLLGIEIFGTQDKKQKFIALVDSGADCSLFNIQIAELLDIDLSKGESVPMTGISGTIKAIRIEEVPITIEGTSDTIKIPACFVDSPTVGALLGQEGFFDQNRIKFEKDHDTFEINPIRK